MPNKRNSRILKTQNFLITGTVCVYYYTMRSWFAHSLQERKVLVLIPGQVKSSKVLSAVRQRCDTAVESRPGATTRRWTIQLLRASPIHLENQIFRT